jgi:hypothetical protein
MLTLPDIQRMSMVVSNLEDQLLAMPQVDLVTENVIHGGMCARTIFIPAGTLLTGALTNIDNICVVQGDIVVTTDDGSKRLTGFNVIPANAGIKRVGLAYADTWWSMIWPTSKTDVTEIEDEMSSESEKLASRRILNIGGVV